MKSDNAFNKVGIIGHSECSLNGVVAAKRASADSFISIVGAGCPIDEVLMEQLVGQLPEDLMNKARQIIEQLKEAGADGSCQPVVAKCILVLIIGGIANSEMLVSGENNHASHPKLELLIIDNMNHVLKMVSDENGDEAVFSDHDIPLSDRIGEEDSSVFVIK